MTPRRLFVFPAGYPEPGPTYVVAFGPSGEPARLAAKSGGQSGYLLDVRHWYTIAKGAEHWAGWRVTTTGYEYRVLDSRKNELLAFHWDPDAKRGPRYPHLHVTAEAIPYVDAITPRSIRLERHHLPTGHILLPWLVQLLVAEFGVAERVRTWPSRLRASEAFLRDG